jgi:hypothetical protein
MICSFRSHALLAVSHRLARVGRRDPGPANLSGQSYGTKVRG